MMKLLVLSLAIVGCLSKHHNGILGGDVLRDSQLKSMFTNWMNENNRSYINMEEEAKRFDIFVTNARGIVAHNTQPNQTYFLGINQFADLTADEFKARVGGDCMQTKPKTTQTYDPSLAKTFVPDSVDWSQKGVVTPVKNQGSCGSCWAFSTTGSIEARTAIKTGKLVSLSEQELVDCSRMYGNQGCQGGLMDNAFKYVKAKGGLCTESSYPYTAKNGVCRQCTDRVDPVKGFVDVRSDSEAALMAAVAEGPVSIAVEADQFSFQFYKSGVVKGTCGTKLDHGVLVVGYGEIAGQKYWKVKNSWGSSWGESGYLLICRECNKNGNDGECGILMQPSYPTV